ncbi:helix-turn-helix domain-containing protein [Lactiplantibacillus plantarum]|uniref:helix-turn-helix domain-containing protein n=1 Tax=Lactiplantibacillus plantarum TaxID=1590 RepID=UPI00280C2F52|nr:helix-turn-helix transcriptional regulator [Lactiplantibacillus plantarum]
MHLQLKIYYILKVNKAVKLQFANVLRRKRKELHLTQQQLADQSLHMTRQTLSRWENNLNYPNLDTLNEDLSEFLAVSSRYFT